VFKQKVLPALVGALVLSYSASSSAAVAVTIDPDGAGGAYGDLSVVSLDWNVGNIIATNQASATTPGSTFTSYAHSSLSVFNYVSGNDTQSLSLAPSREWTFVTSFLEQVTAKTATRTEADIISSPSNFFQIWYDPTPDSSQLTGKGFNDGVLILEASGTAANVTGSGDFEADTTPLGAPNIENLDQSNVNNYPNITTVTGSGTTIINASVTYVNNAFFKGVAAGDSFQLFFNTLVKLPFEQTNPSSCYWDGAAYQGAAGAYVQNDGVTPGVGACANTIGTVNGAGRNALFQSDPNMAFNAVPEPGALGLLGMAAIGLAGAGLRRSRKMAVTV